METKKVRLKKIIAAISAFVLIGFVLFFANGMIGNPLSKILANKAAERYIAENYSDLDLKLEKAFYNFKDGRYNVNVSSTSSIDTHFSLNYSWSGKLEYDDYESLVLGKWNTFQRIDSEYRKLVDTQIETRMDLSERDFIYGEITMEDGFSGLEIDKKYDIKELAKEQGHIQFTLERDIRNAGVIAQTLVNVKELFDKENIPFNNISIDLHQPRQENPNKENLLEPEYLMLKGFLYTDIYQDDLEKRVVENIEETRLYYEQQDEEMKKEIEEFESNVKENN